MPGSKVGRIMVELSKMEQIVRLLAEKSHCFLNSGHVEREVEYLNLDFHHDATIHPLDMDGNVVLSEYLHLKIYRNRVRFFGSKYNEYAKRLEKLQRIITKTMNVIF